MSALCCPVTLRRGQQVRAVENGRLKAHTHAACQHLPHGGVAPRVMTLANVPYGFKMARREQVGLARGSQTHSTAANSGDCPGQRSAWPYDRSLGASGAPKRPRRLSGSFEGRFGVLGCLLGLKMLLVSPSHRHVLSRGARSTTFRAFPRWVILRARHSWRPASCRTANVSREIYEPRTKTQVGRAAALGVRFRETNCLLWGSEADLSNATDFGRIGGPSGHWPPASVCKPNWSPWR
jgi:hypothetical protein